MSSTTCRAKGSAQSIVRDIERGGELFGRHVWLGSAPGFAVAHKWI